VKLSVVIPTFNRAQLLRRLLAQLADQTASEFEVCVVDDGSSPPVRELLADLEPPYKLQLIAQENRGAAAARHEGVLAATGALILFVDDDMQVGRDFIAQHLQAHEGAARAVVLGRIRADPALAERPLFERWHSTLLDKKAAAIAAGALEVRGNLFFTGNVSLPRADYLATGGFDTSLGHSEDVELGLRLEQAGLSFRFSEAASTLHGSDHTSLDKWRSRARQYGHFDHRVAAKHPGLRHASPWRFVYDLNALARPFIAASVLAPRLSGEAARLAAHAAEWADRLGLQRPAQTATTLAYAVNYFGGVREEAGSTLEALQELMVFAGRFGKSPALSAFAAIKQDQAVMAAYESKYGHQTPSSRNLPSDVVQKIGLQLMAACRLMRALRDGGSPLGAKVMSRLIRHAYSSDIHWDAELAPGVMIVHGMGLAISHAARVGRGCILFQNVTLGMGTDKATGMTGAPTLEENVHVGPGATLIGPITIGAGSKIMAGAVLTRSVPPGSLVETPSPEVRPRVSARALRAVTT
jgi:serine acetyltransferase/GT2 family glycosyltransferase